MAVGLQQPFFSILIPSYNRPEYIGRSIESVLADPFKSVEIVISDDNSPRREEVRQAVEPYLKHDNIRFFQQPENLREPNNKNFLIRQAEGRYSIILGDDDRFFPNALSKLKSHIDAYPDYELYCFGYEIVDEHDRTIVSRRSPKMFEISDEKPRMINEMFSADMLPLWLFHPNTFCCKNGVEKELRYSTDVGIGEDMYFIFEFLTRGKKMLVLPERMFFWRKIQDVNASKQINQSLAVLSDYAARKLMYDKLQQDSKINSSLRRFMDTKEYRIRFLYTSIISDPRISKSLYTREGMKTLNMSEEMLEEFLDYATRVPLEKIRRQHYVNRIFTYLKLVGIRGLGPLSKLFYQRIANNLHMRTARADKN